MADAWRRIEPVKIFGRSQIVDSLKASPAGMYALIALTLQPTPDADTTEQMIADPVFWDCVNGVVGAGGEGQAAEPEDFDAGPVFAYLAERFGFTPTDVADMTPAQLSMYVASGPGIVVDRKTGRRVAKVSGPAAAAAFSQRVRARRNNG